jgi:hypothetical protein
MYALESGKRDGKKCLEARNPIMPSLLEVLGCRYVDE